MKTLLSAFAFVATGFYGCTLPPYVPQITAFKDPAYFDKTFQCVVVFADTSNLAVRQNIENMIAKRLDEDGVCATPAHLHLPPTRAWSLQERKKFFDANGVDSYLVVSVRNAGVDETYIPPKITTTRTTKNDKIETPKDTTKKRERTKTTEIEKEEITTHQSGGYTQYSPWVEYEVRLFDAATDQTAWLAMRTVYPESYGSVYDFYDLVSDRMIYDNIVFADKNKEKRKNPFEIINRVLQE